MPENAKRLRTHHAAVLPSGKREKGEGGERLYHNVRSSRLASPPSVQRKKRSPTSIHILPMDCVEKEGGGKKKKKEATHPMNTLGLSTVLAGGEGEGTPAFSYSSRQGEKRKRKRKVRGKLVGKYPWSTGKKRKNTPTSRYLF